VTDLNKDRVADDQFRQLPAVGMKGLPPTQCLKNDNGSGVAMGVTAP